MEYKRNFGREKISASQTCQKLHFGEESGKAHFPQVLKTPKMELLINQGYGKITFSQQRSTTPITHTFLKG
jgi:hypothetical protein